jgi:hypothetical protein
VKKLLVASVVSIVVVGGLGLYVVNVLGGVQKRFRELEAVFETRAKELRETDTLFPYAGGPHLDATRFPAWLEVRTRIAKSFAGRVKEPGDAFHGPETKNDMLAILRSELVERKMSLAEYRATEARWQELLALPEFAELQQSWRERTAYWKCPQGLPLPPPAADAQEKELEQIRRYAPQLEESMDADLLAPLLDRVEGKGKGPGGRG